MEKNEANPLTPLKSVGLGDEEKQQLWCDILDAVVHNTNTIQKPLRRRWSSLQNMGTAAAVVVILAGVWVGVTHSHQTKLLTASSGAQLAAHGMASGSTYSGAGTKGTTSSSAAATGIQQSASGAGSTNGPSGGATASSTAPVYNKNVTLLGGNPIAPATVPTLPTQVDQTPVGVAVIHATYGSPAPKLQTLPRTVQMSVPTALANQFTAYYLPLGTGSFYILAPSGLTTNAEVGADGSYRVSLTGLQGEVDLSSSGACQGCVPSAAAMYFPSARAVAKQDGGGAGIHFENFPVRTKFVNPNLLLWGYEEKQQRFAAGFAAYELGPNQPTSFVAAVFVGSTQQVKKVAPWVLQNLLLQQKVKY